MPSTDRATGRSLVFRTTKVLFLRATKILHGKGKHTPSREAGTRIDLAARQESPSPIQVASVARAGITEHNQFEPFVLNILDYVSATGWPTFDVRCSLTAAKTVKISHLRRDTRSLNEHRVSERTGWPGQRDHFNFMALAQ